MTANDVAAKFNVSKSLAAAFLKFMELRGLATAKSVHTPGVRGKGTKVYQFTDTATADFSTLVTTLTY